MRAKVEPPIEKVCSLIKKTFDDIRTARRSIRVDGQDHGGAIEARHFIQRIIHLGETNWGRIEPYVQTYCRAPFVKKAIKQLIKDGKIACLPVRNSYKSFRKGVPYYKVHHYEYRWVDNALELLALKA
jgi:hypothetical protein